MSGRNIIVVSIALTVVWLCSLYALVGYSMQCLEAIGTFEVWFSCRTTNEIGDFLAGAFAPLAFLWLVATVLIQSSSLSKQSEELELGREEQQLIRQELKLARIASEAQLEETRKSIQILDQQLEVERSARLRSVEDRNDIWVRKLISNALDLFEDRLSGKRLFSLEGTNVNVASSSGAVKLEKRLHEMSQSIEGAKAKIASMSGSKRPKISRYEDWAELGDLLKEICKTLPESSYAMKVTVSPDKMDDLLQAALSITSMEG